MNDKEFEDQIRAVCNQPETSETQCLRDSVQRRLERFFAENPALSDPFFRSLSERMHPRNRKPSRP